MKSASGHSFQLSWKRFALPASFLLSLTHCRSLRLAYKCYNHLFKQTQPAAKCGLSHEFLLGGSQELFDRKAMARAIQIVTSSIAGPKRRCLPKWKHKARRKHLGHQVSPEISDSALHNLLHTCIELPLLPIETFPQIECFMIVHASAEQSGTKNVHLRVCFKIWWWRGQVRFVIMIFKLSFRRFLI